MNRRSFLAVSGTALSVLSAGCSDLGPGDEKRDYTFSIHNGSRESHSIRIRIGNDVSSSSFYQESFELDPETATEDIPIDEIPSSIFVRIDSADEREFPWPASHSELGTIALRAEIYYEPLLDQELRVVAQ